MLLIEAKVVGFDSFDICWILTVAKPLSNITGYKIHHSSSFIISLYLFEREERQQWLHSRLRIRDCGHISLPMYREFVIRLLTSLSASSINYSISRFFLAFFRRSFSYSSIFCW